MMIPPSITVHKMLSVLMRNVVTLANATMDISWRVTTLHVYVSQDNSYYYYVYHSVVMQTKLEFSFEVIE